MESFTTFFGTQYLQSPLCFTTHYMHNAGIHTNTSRMKPTLGNQICNAVYVLPSQVRHTYTNTHTHTNFLLTMRKFCTIAVYVVYRYSGRIHSTIPRFSDFP